MYIFPQLTETAVYWCGQAANLSHGEEQDILRWADSLIVARQYHRATHLLKESKLQSSSWRGCFLAANAMYLANNIEEAFKILEASEILLEKKTIDAASKENPPTKEV